MGSGFLERYEDKLSGFIDTSVRTGRVVEDGQIDFSIPAPNAIEWAIRPEFLNVDSIYENQRQYQIVRDYYQLRCPICNSPKLEAKDCWGKGREYLESENLLVWSHDYQDERCPKCKTTKKEFFADGLLHPVDTLVVIAGMRSGKSATAGGICGTYTEHRLITLGCDHQGALQEYFQVLSEEEFQVGFVATTAEQTEETVWKWFTKLRKRSPWLAAYIKWVKEKEKLQDIPKGVKGWKYKELEDEIEDGWIGVKYISLHSNSAGLAGRTRVFAFIDELSRFDTGESKRSGQEVWDVMDSSLETTRGAKNELGLVPWLGGQMTITSPISKTDQGMVLYNGLKGEDTAYTGKWATWEYNPRITRESLDRKFRLNPILAERNFGANPPDAQSPFIQDGERFWKAIDFDLKPTVEFITQTITDAQGREYKAAKIDRANLVLNHMHFIRADAGSTFDAFSLCCAHGEWVPMAEFFEGIQIDPEVEMLKAVAGNELQHGGYIPGGNELKYGGYIPQPSEHNLDITEGMVWSTVVDWVLRILPEKGRKVWFDSIITIVRQLSQKCNIGGVYFDRWNSESSVQAIGNMSIDSDYDRVKAEDFTRFYEESILGKIHLLPPEDDEVDFDPIQGLQVKVRPPLLSGPGCAIYELYHLEQSENLKKIFNPRKGKVRGENSDDTAQVVVGAHKTVQASIKVGTKGPEDRKRRELHTGSQYRGGGLARYTGWS